MLEKRRSFTPEYKEEAAKMVIEGSVPRRLQHQLHRLKTVFRCELPALLLFPWVDDGDVCLS